MELISEFFRNMEGSFSSYIIALALIVIWWVGRFFVRRFKEASAGGRMERTDEPERPRRRIPLD